jgi:2EXR family/SAP domain
MAQSHPPRRPIEELASNRNPFNYFHRRTPWPVAQLRDELLRRGLPPDGTRAELVDRIKTHNDYVISPEGVRERYHRRLTIVKEAAMEAIVPFPQFSRLPVEIRLMIWKYSLPGPRVLTVTKINIPRPDKLHFREDDNPPNPGMLSVCRESRSVALERFKLCLRTPNVYADFSGGDILYFGPNWGDGYGGFLLEGFRNPELLSDIRQTSRVALSNKIWRKFSKPEYMSRDGRSLRFHVHRIFPNLKELFLIKGGPDYDLGSEFAKTPGHIVFEERPDLYIRSPPTTWDWAAYGFAYDVREKFMMLDKEPDEKVWFAGIPEVKGIPEINGIPEVKIVIEKRIPNIPGDDWERDKGEPFVSTSYLPTKTLAVVTNPTIVSAS